MVTPPDATDGFLRREVTGDAKVRPRGDRETEKSVVWVHGDGLDPNGPALAAHCDAPAIWVWDQALLEEWGITLKRVVFIYECLLELPVPIRRGDVAAEVVAFAREEGATRVATTASPSSRFAAIGEKIGREMPLEILPVPPLIASDGPFDLARFGRYWRVAQRHLFGQWSLFD